MIKAVIFDRDGVLVDTEPIHLLSVIKALKDFGLDFSSSDSNLILGISPPDYKSKFLSKYKVDWGRYSKLQAKYYYELLDAKDCVFHEVVKLVRELKKSGFKLALTTSSGKGGTAKILALAGLENVFDVVVTREDCAERKPSPLPYLITAKKLGLPASECLVIEDTEIGLSSAKSAKMKCVVLKSDNSAKESFLDADLVLSVKDINIKKISFVINN